MTRQLTSDMERHWNGRRYRLPPKRLEDLGSGAVGWGGIFGGRGELTRRIVPI